MKKYLCYNWDKANMFIRVLNKKEKTAYELYKSHIVEEDNIKIKDNLREFRDKNAESEEVRRVIDKLLSINEPMIQIWDRSGFEHSYLIKPTWYNDIPDDILNQLQPIPVCISRI